MKKLLILLILGFSSLQTQAQHFFVLDLQGGPTVAPLTNYPVWLRVIPAGGGTPYNISGLTDNSGLFMDTLNSPSGSTVIAMTYDCNRNLVSSSALIQSGGDTLMVGCPVWSGSGFCSVDFITLGSSSGLTVNLQDSIFSVSKHSLTTYNWDFGDGTTATGRSVSHTYSSPGTYQVCFTSSSFDTISQIMVCSDSICRNITVNYVQPSCYSDFNLHITGAYARRNDASNVAIPAGGSARYITDFGDGNIDTSFTNQQLIHHYTSNGPFNVCYTVEVLDSNNTVLCTDVKCRTYNPTFNCTLFVIDSIHGSSDTGLFRMYSFRATNTNVQIILNFGDGDSTILVNPVTNIIVPHLYPGPGVYNYSVSLLIYNNNGDSLCTDYINGSIVIGAGTPNNLYCKASYIVDTSNSSSGNVMVWNMSSADSGAGISYQWSFGDGNTSTQAYPTHTYANPGMYQVCLKVTAIRNADTCIAIWCDSLGVDANGNLLYNGKGNGGWVLNVMDPNSVSLNEKPIGSMEVYPNPTKGNITISFPQKQNIIYWRIYDLKGSLYLSGEKNGSDEKELNLDLEKLSRGMYILQVQTESGVNHFKIKLED